MLHNVPIARILGFLFLGSVILIGFVTYEGYRTSMGRLAAFIVGGGAHTHALPAWMHGLLALIALAMNLITAVVAVVCISDNIVLIEEIDAALPETAAD